MNVGVGILRDPNDEHFTVNQGWDPSQVHLPDNSVIDSVDFVSVPDQKDDNGPHTFTLPAMPNMFLDTSTLRVCGKAKIKYISSSDGEQTTLPVNDAIEKNILTSKRPILRFGNKADAATDTDKANLADGESLTIKVKKRKAPPAEGYETAETELIASLDMEYPDYKEKQAKVAPINHFIQSLWKDIEVKMNGVTVTKNSNLEYPIRTYLENLLYYGTEAQKTHMSTEMWTPDEYFSDEEDPGNWDFVDDGVRKTDDATKYEKEPFVKTHMFAKNKGYHLRRAKYSQNNEFDFVFSMHTELNTISSFIYDGVNFQFQFQRNRPEFCLMAENNETAGYYVIRLTDFRLKGRYMIPSPKIETALGNYIKRNSARYATRRNQVFTTYVSKGDTSFTWPNIFCSDVLPDQILMVMVKANAKNGSLTYNPWYFQHFDANNITMQINARNLPKQGLKQDFRNNLYRETYRELFDNLGIGNSNIGIPITPLKFKHGHSIFAWDLNHDKCAGMHNNHSKMNGVADLKVNFAKPLPENIAVVVFGIYRDYLTLDSERAPNVMSSYGVGALPYNAFEMGG